MYRTLDLNTGPGESLTDLTDRVSAVLAETDVRTGTCFVFVPHTTAAITINSSLDPGTLDDLVHEVKRLVPTRTDFRHIVDTPSDAAGHIKSTLIGNSETLMIADGALVLGRAQRLLFFDFDGPRSRRVLVRISGD